MNYLTLEFTFLSLFINIFGYELNSDRIKILDSTINSLMELAKLKTVGIIITNSNKTIYQNIYGETDKVNTKSSFVLGSVSKTFTALALLYLNIPLNITLDKFDLKDYIKEKDAKDITISELLNHSSGLNSFSSSIISKRGTFSYSNYGYALLGKIIEKESKKSYHDYLDEKIFKPLNMTNTHAKYHKDIIDSYDFLLGFRTKYPNIKSEFGDGFYIPAGYITSSIEDMGNYLRFYLNKSDANQKYVSKMTNSNLTVSYNINYGIGMIIEKRNEKIRYYHEGIIASFLSRLVLYPELDVGIFIFTNTRDSLCPGLGNEFFNNIENFLIFDSISGINNSSFFYYHFTWDILFIFILTPPLIYLIFTLKRKIKTRKYFWFKGIKGKIYFGIDLFILVIAPIIIIIIFYTADPNLKKKIEMTRDYQFIIFTTSSILFLTFVIKLGYIFFYNWLLSKYNLGGSNEKIEDLDIDFFNLEQ